MINLNNANPDEIALFGHNLFYNHGNDLSSFEDTAQLCSRSIFETFQEEDGQSTFALVRFYRFCKTDELLPELLDNNAGATNKWLALMGTIGDEPNWCDRRLSQKHQAVPINDDLSLMFKTIFNQLGLSSQKFNEPLPVTVGNSTIPMVKYFYVPNAHDNPAIPDKDNFVIPYGIQSVIGIGSPFLSGSFYIGLFFSKVFLNHAQVETFVELATPISTLLATYDRGNSLWIDTSTD